MGRNRSRKSLRQKKVLSVDFCLSKTAPNRETTGGRVQVGSRNDAGAVTVSDLALIVLQPMVGSAATMESDPSGATTIHGLPSADSGERLEPAAWERCCSGDSTRPPWNRVEVFSDALLPPRQSVSPAHGEIMPDRMSVPITTLSKRGLPGCRRSASARACGLTPERSHNGYDVTRLGAWGNLLHCLCTHTTVRRHGHSCKPLPQDTRTHPINADATETGHK